LNTTRSHVRVDSEAGAAIPVARAPAASEWAAAAPLAAAIAGTALAWLPVERALVPAIGETLASRLFPLICLLLAAAGCVGLRPSRGRFSTLVGSALVAGGIALAVLAAGWASAEGPWLAAAVVAVVPGVGLGLLLVPGRGAAGSVLGFAAAAALLPLVQMPLLELHGTGPAAGAAVLVALLGLAPLAMRRGVSGAPEARVDGPFGTIAGLAALALGAGAALVAVAIGRLLRPFVPPTASFEVLRIAAMCGGAALGALLATWYARDRTRRSMAGVRATAALPGALAAALVALVVVLAHMWTGGTARTARGVPANDPAHLDATWWAATLFAALAAPIAAGAFEWIAGRGRLALALAGAALALVAGSRLASPGATLAIGLAGIAIAAARPLLVPRSSGQAGQSGESAGETWTARLLVVLPLGVAIGAWFLAPPAIGLPPGLRLDVEIETPEARLGVLRAAVDPPGSTFATPPLLRIDSRIVAGGDEGSRLARRAGALPALLHPSPRSAALFALGDGSTALALLDCGLQAIRIVAAPTEEPSLLARLRRADVAANPRITFARDSAARYLATSVERFDLIVELPFDPAAALSGSRVVTEHYLAAAARLAPRGIYAQWFRLDSLDFDTFGTASRAFAAAFEQVLVVIADPEAADPWIGLLGAAELTIEFAALEARITRLPAGSEERLRSGIDVLELCLGDRHTLASRFGGERLAGGGEALPTRAHPFFEFRAAASRESPLVRLLNNLNNVAINFGDTVQAVIALPDDWSDEQRSEFQVGLGKRVAALRKYLAGGYWERRAATVGDDVVGDLGRAADQWRGALVDDPRHGATARAVDRLVRRHLRDGRLREGFEIGVFALAQDPANADFARDVGLAALLLGEDATARRAFEIAIESGDDAFALTGLAAACWLTGDEKAAGDAATRALAASGGEPNHLASAVRLAADGADEAASRVLAGLADHPHWAALASRIHATLAAGN
jgi:spermidine synthase